MKKLRILHLKSYGLSDLDVDGLIQTCLNIQVITINDNAFGDRDHLTEIVNALNAKKYLCPTQALFANFSQNISIILKIAIFKWRFIIILELILDFWTFKKLSDSHNIRFRVFNMKNLEIHDPLAITAILLPYKICFSSNSLTSYPAFEKTVPKYANSDTCSFYPH